MKNRLRGLVERSATPVAIYNPKDWVGKVFVFDFEMIGKRSAELTVRGVHGDKVLVTDGHKNIVLSKEDVRTGLMKGRIRVQH